MEGFIPTGGAGSTAKVQDAQDDQGALGNLSCTFSVAPTVGNMLIAVVTVRGDGSVPTTPTGYTLRSDVQSTSFDGGRMFLYSKVAGAVESATLNVSAPAVSKQLYWAEWSGLTAFDLDAELDAQSGATTMTTSALTISSAPAVLFAGFVQAARVPTLTLQSPFATDNFDHTDNSGPSTIFGHRIISSGTGPYTATTTSTKLGGWGAVIAAFTAGSGGITWIAAPDTVDEADGTSDDVDDVAIANTAGAFWRGDVGHNDSIGSFRALIGFTNNADVTVIFEAGDEPDWSDAAEVVRADFEATGSLTADEIEITFDAVDHRYWRLVLDTTAQDVRVYEVTFGEATEHVPTPAAKAILELYMHDEDASRWGTATWSTGPATGTEGIWSAAGWQDVTPEGVNAHIIWGSRRPGRGILAGQDPASWNVETYDPDRILDPGNFDSPYYPQLVAGIPIRISHEGLVIRTGIIEELSYKHKPPDYRGQILATDTIALLHKAAVPADSILADTLHARIIDAIEAAGIGVGGIPLPPPDYGGPALADWVEGAATDEPTSVWEIARKAVEEIHWVAYVNHDASLGLRSWGAPLNRGREISAPNLEDLRSVVNEDGVYSVARVQVADPDLDPIEREASPLPRYGRRVIERREPTIDPEGWADAVLAERSWPGVQYVPGAIHCFTAADVNDFGSLQIMEYVTLTVPGAVSVQGRILGGELWVEHRAGSERGATWIFLFQVATDGATAIGLTTLVADGTGETLLDDMTETDFLEAD